VEITPYLTDDLAGTGTLDLYDNWELIDPPAGMPQILDQTPAGVP
jgi:hypothetical protein